MIVPMAAAWALAAVRPAPWTASAKTNAAGRLFTRFEPTAAANAVTTMTAAGESRTCPNTICASHAAVVLKDGAQLRPDDVIGWCKEKLAAYKTPARVDIVKELPKSATGKILKRMLRQQA